MENKEEEKKINIKKCDKCGKEGWISTSGYEKGDLFKRLCICMFPKKSILCLDCIENNNK